jgi:hypothetical protein
VVHHHQLLQRALLQGVLECVRPARVHVCVCGGVVRTCVCVCVCVLGRRSAHLRCDTDLSCFVRPK